MHVDAGVPGAAALRCRAGPDEALASHRGGGSRPQQPSSRLGDGKPRAVLAKAQQNHTKEVATGFTVTGPRAEARRGEGSPPFQVTASRRAEWGDRHLLL